jgi:ATP/maltotriose-dependent transcriptional regulator MalT
MTSSADTAVPSADDQTDLGYAERAAFRRSAAWTPSAELPALRRRADDDVALLTGVSSLTAAELRVLSLLTTYLSFQEIADRLVVSRNTVKTHVMAIYGKLEATSRSEAVERAVEVGLLEPFAHLAPPWRSPDA